MIKEQGAWRNKTHFLKQHFSASLDRNDCVGGEPSDIVSLPKGQAFALLEGGQLWKIRMPLPAGDAADEHMPDDITRLAEEMRRNYHSSEGWWNGGAAGPGALKGDDNG